jgi:glutamate synthase domain-containing protein 2
VARYRIETKPAPAPFAYPGRFQKDETDLYVKYGHRVFAGTAERGDPYWTAEIITQTWFQAETGRVPISGAGYGGPFSGEGFDGMWLDMSEIVRPTRDGIHGRETISTAVVLGGAPEALEFDAQGRLTTRLPPTLDLPLPVALGPLPMPLPGRAPLRALTAAADRLGTLAIHATDALAEASRERLAVRLTAADFDNTNVLNEVRARRPVYVELEEEPWDLERWEWAGKLFPEALVALRRGLGADSPAEVEKLWRKGVRVFHLYGDLEGRDRAGRPLPDSLRAVHTHAVQRRWRDSLSFLVSGGIAAAEHLPKIIACGADMVVTDLIPQIAWGCALWAERGGCHPETTEVEPGWAAQRLTNLLAAWRDQLLEALGAMGLREVRRLRGETGRIIFDEIESKAFRRLFAAKAPLSAYRRLKEGSGAEGDMRWTHGLLVATREQARLSRPGGEMEFRVGGSGGGFDRLAFRFELEDTWQAQHAALLEGGQGSWLADPAQVDLSLELNRRGDDERPKLRIPVPWYGAGMSFGSIGLGVMLARARAAKELGGFMSTGEGGYPEELAEYADHVITQVATGLFGVREASIQRARLLEIKYAQGAKPGLGGHLLGGKNTAAVAREREAVQGTSLFSPFPFHSVYSVEDHKKHLDWLKQINPRALVSVKVSTPTDVDMVAVGSYFAGAHIVHLDGAYGGTGAAPEIAKKNIAMPIEYAIPKVHRFLEGEGLREKVTLMASGGVRTAYDVAKAIALGADGCVIGTAELAAIGCSRLGSCEQGLGCPFGITTTDPERSKLVEVETAWQQIFNVYQSWRKQLAAILRALGMSRVGELRGRTDLLVHLE